MRPPVLEISVTLPLVPPLLATQTFPLWSMAMPVGVLRPTPVKPVVPEAELGLPEGSNSTIAPLLRSAIQASPEGSMATGPGVESPLPVNVPDTVPELDTLTTFPAPLFPIHALLDASMAID